MKKLLYSVLLLSFVICGRTFATDNTTSSDALTRVERMELTNVLKKLQVCQNAELSGQTFSFKVSRNGSLCTYIERNNDKTMTCNFPMQMAKKYGENAVILNTAILENGVANFNPFQNSSTNRSFMENLNMVQTYCK